MDLCEFKASLVYIEGSMKARATKNLSQKQNYKTKQTKSRGENVTHW